jgi:hypothetical protein
MINYWLHRADAIFENELVLVRNSPETKNWYDRMPTVIPVIYPDRRQPLCPSEFGPKVGIAHHLRYTRHGIEGVLKAPRKYHRLSYYVLHDKVNQPSDPFWVILFKNMD